MTRILNIAEELRRLLGAHHAVRITSREYMPLSVEAIGRDAESRFLLSIMHWGIQEGDLMRDPEMVFAFSVHDGEPIAEPIEFRNDYLGIHQEVYVYDEHGQRTQVRPRLKRELEGFSQLWLTNLHEQGFFEETATRHVLRG